MCGLDLLIKELTYINEMNLEIGLFLQQSEHFLEEYGQMFHGEDTGDGMLKKHGRLL